MITTRFDTAIYYHLNNPDIISPHVRKQQTASELAGRRKIQKKPHFTFWSISSKFLSYSNTKFWLLINM